MGPVSYTHLDVYKRQEQELYAENICFILNKLMPVVYNAAVIGVTRESNDAIGKFKSCLLYTSSDSSKTSSTPG